MKTSLCELLALVTASLCLSLSGGASVASAQDEGVAFYNLQPQWVEGRTTRYRFETVRSDDVAMSVNDQTREAQTRMRSAGEMTWTVREVGGDGSAELEVVYDWLGLSFTPPQGRTAVRGTPAVSIQGGGAIPAQGFLCRRCEGRPFRPAFPSRH